MSTALPRRLGFGEPGLFYRSDSNVEVGVGLRRKYSLRSLIIRGRGNENYSYDYCRVHQNLRVLEGLESMEDIRWNVVAHLQNCIYATKPDICFQSENDEQQPLENPSISLPGGYKLNAINQGKLFI